MPLPLALVLLVLLAACGPDDPPPPPPVVSMEPGMLGSATPMDDTVGVRWETVAEQDEGSRSPRPVEFSAPGAVLRITTTARGLRWPYVPGLLVANVLSGPTLALEGSVRTELTPDDTLGVVVDTTFLRAAGRPLYLFVPEHSTLLRWEVRVEAGRAPQGSR